jgi:hypothetical protein
VEGVNIVTDTLPCDFYSCSHDIAKTDLQMKYNKNVPPSLRKTGLDKARCLKPGPDFVQRTATKTDSDVGKETLCAMKYVLIQLQFYK